MSDDGHGMQPGAQDRGAAVERTALAWQRSGLGLVIGYFVVFVTAARLGEPVLAAAAGLIGLLIAIAAAALPARLWRDSPADSHLLLSVTAISAVILGVLGALAAAISLLRT